MYEPSQALALYEQALVIQRTIANHFDEAKTLAGMGALAHSIGRPTAGFKLVLSGATLFADAHLAAPSWLDEALATQTQNLSYDETRLETLRAEVLSTYANDRGDSLIHEAFPQGAT